MNKRLTNVPATHVETPPPVGTTAFTTPVNAGRAMQVNNIDYPQSLTVWCICNTSKAKQIFLDEMIVYQEYSLVVNTLKLLAVTTGQWFM